MKELDAQGARQLFDREVAPDTLLEWTAQAAAPKPAKQGARQGVLLVRAGEEWLGLPTSIVDAALPMSPVHSVPYLSSPVFAGLCNVDGELLPCIRLAALLGALPAQTAPDGSGGSGGLVQAPASPRLIALTLPEGRFALEVDEAAGTGGYDPEAPSPLVLRMAVVEGRLAGIAEAASLGRALLRSLRP
jgi:chemotaxis-related protein WspD